MNCIIIEDEHHAVKHLENQIAKLDERMNIIAKIDSVEEAVPWLKNNKTDLIFLDVQLDDGLSFEIFDHVQVKTPVIFTTSYDQYITKAFEVNSLSYLLKPIKLESLKMALSKYRSLYGNEPAMNEKIIPFNNDYQKRFLVRSGTTFDPLSIEDIAYFHVQGRFLFIVTKNKVQYLYDSIMEILEQRLDPEIFFRVNRNFIVNFKAIKQLHTFDRGRLRIEVDPECKEEIIVSINKTTIFKHWLDR